jgi:Tol biopolymer transport system component
MLARAILLALSALAFTAIAVSASQAHSPTAGKNGRIVFRRYLDVAKTTGAIFTVNPNGTNVRRVTRGGSGVNDTEPDWSADGTKIAFVRQTRCPPDGPRNGLNGTCDLVYTVARDGSDLRSPVPCGFDAKASFPGNCVGVSHPAWSPDGSKLAYQWNLVDRRYSGSFNMQAGIWISDADGGSPRQVTQRTPGRSWDFGAQWSPDGTRLAFFRLDLKTDREAIFTVRVDGSQERRVTPKSISGANPNWSPDGRWILFNGEKRGAPVNVFRIRPDGTGLKNLTKEEAGGFEYLSASFAPDGRMIATGRTPGTGREGAADVVVMRADGSKIRPVTKTRLWDSGADWGRAPIE